MKIEFDIFSTKRGKFCSRIAFLSAPSTSLGLQSDLCRLIHFCSFTFYAQTSSMKTGYCFEIGIFNSSDCIPLEYPLHNTEQNNYNFMIPRSYVSILCLIYLTYFVYISYINNTNISYRTRL